jgi:predicted RNA-binding Zn ribbon-like protein
MKLHLDFPEKLAGEELSIKFVNTVAWRLRDPVEERVASPEAVLKWLLDARLVDRSSFLTIKARWKRAPREGKAFFEAAVELREAIYSLFVALIEDKKADSAATGVLNMHLAGSMRNLALISSQKGLEWKTSSGAIAPEALLRPIAWSAAGLLTGPRAQRVKQCQDERGCGWLFIDESRAQNRRWCSMGDCGNLAKSRRHYLRATCR